MKTYWIGRFISIKNLIFNSILIILFATTLHSFNYFSSIIKNEEFNVTSDKLTFKLKYQNLIVNSEKVFNDSTQFIRNKDYKINYQTNEITFFKNGIISIEYLIFPQDLIKRFYLYQEQTLSDSSEIKLPLHQKKHFYSETNLNITGNKTISISVASNEDFSLDQSLFLRINGNLSSDLQIDAQLSDSQSPITPEGDSREISNLDQIYLRLYSKNYELSFGDLEMEFTQTKFMNYTPKFEGLKAGWIGKNMFSGALAISKGKKTTINFMGLEAKQGPYYLSVEGVNGVKLVPGSEKIYLDGLLMQRGKDYIIDYSEGSITFTNRNFISSNSFIEASFQYTDENYRQNMYLASSDIKIGNNLQFNNYLAIQNDDKNNPLQDIFSEDDIRNLQNAGDNIAWGNGIYEVEIGEGSYIKIQDDSLTYYQFVGSDSIGNYNIYFSYVGEKRGLYVTEEEHFVYVGTDNQGNMLGSYLPQKRLFPPEKKENYDINTFYSNGFVNLKMEGLFSKYDRNIFSKSDDNDNNGYAANIILNLIPDFDKIKPDLSFQYRKLSDNLSTFANIKNPQDSYEFTSLPDSISSEEFFYNLQMNILNYYSPQIVIRKKNLTNFAKQNYLSLTSDLKQKWMLPNIYHRYLSTIQDFKTDSNSDIKNSNIIQNTINSSYTIKKIKFGTEYYYKKSETKYNFLEDKIGKKIRRFNYNISTIKTKSFTTNIFYNEEKNDSLKYNRWFRIKTSKTIGINSLLKTKKNNLKINFSHRKVTENQKENQFDLAEISSNNSIFKDALSLNSNYSIKNIEFYPKIIKFQYVGENLGQYDEDTLFVGIGDYDWKVTSIDYEHPEMSVEVNANVNLYLNPDLITKGFLKKFHSETYGIITENSKSSNKKNLYLLQPNVLMNSNNTIYGKNIFRQILWYNIIHRKLISKVRFQNEKTLDNRYQDSVTNSIQIWEAMLRLLQYKKTNFEFTFENRIEEDSKYDSKIKSNSFNINVRNNLSHNFTLQSSLKITTENGEKKSSITNYKINSYELSENITLFFLKKYRMFSKFSFKRNQRNGLFLNFSPEKKSGNILKTSINFDYKLNRYTSANINYSGKIYPSDEDIHQLKMELKAEF